MSKKSLLPILKIHEKRTHPFRALHIPLNIVKVEELLLSNGKPNQELIKTISKEGGLREFLDTSGRIIFSSIMPDPLLEHIKFDPYRFLFKEFQPEMYITPDAPTYSSCQRYSRGEIDKILDLTSKLIHEFPESVPIGLIKGCNFYQKDFHTDKLRELGITRYCLHAGDCLNNAPIYAKDAIVDYSRAIAEKVPHLMIYGVGSNHYFQRFHSAKSYATSSHWMQAFNHMIIRGSTWINYPWEITREHVMQNFHYLCRLLDQSKDKREITHWISDPISIDKDERKEKSLSVDPKIIKIMGK